MLKTNITSPLTTLPPPRQSASYHSSTYKYSGPKPKTHVEPRSAHLSPSHTVASFCVSKLHSSSHWSVSTHDIYRYDSSFSRQSPSVRRTGHNSSVDNQGKLLSSLEYSRSSSTSTRRKCKSPNKSRHETFAIPTSLSEFSLLARPSERASSMKDWRRLFLFLCLTFIVISIDIA